jgi:uncharacterized protein YjeT (DUF2065 family)
MSDQIFLGAIIGPMFLVMGLSILMYPSTWVKLVKEWTSNHFHMFSLMLFSIVFGLVIINSYNIWEWSPWVIITLSGWIALIKGIVYFLLPGNSFKNMLTTFNRKELYLVDGVILTGLGGWLSYLVYMA